MSPQTRTEVTSPGELAQVGLPASLDLKEGNTDSLVEEVTQGQGGNRLLAPLLTLRVEMDREIKGL